jgi:hypothetical protein
MTMRMKCCGLGHVRTSDTQRERAETLYQDGRIRPELIHPEIQKLRDFCTALEQRR